MAKSKTEKKSKPAKAPKADKAAPEVETGVSTISVSQLINPSKNLIVRESHGDMDALVDSIKRDGQLQSLLVRPGKKAGTFEVLCGHRRWEALRKAKIKTAKVIIRTDLTEDETALGVVMSENSPEGRCNLTPIEQARVFDRMCKDLGDDSHAPGKVAKKCATTAENVRRTRGLLSAPKAVLDSLNEGIVSKDAVLSLQQIGDEKIRNKVAKAMAAGEVTSRPEVLRAAKDIGAAMEAAGEEATAPADGRKVSRAARVWRSHREITETFDGLVWAYGVANGDIDDTSTAQYKRIKGNKEAANLLAVQIVALMWVMGMLDTTDPSSKAAKKALAAEVELAIEKNGEETEEEESEEAEESDDSDAPEEEDADSDEDGDEDEGEEEEAEEADADD